MTSASSNNNFDEIISQEEQERKLREKLEHELASKEREIAALVIDTQKLQSTLIKVKETSVAQVEEKRTMNKIDVYILTFIQISDLENVLSTKEMQIAQLENKLHSQTDYDEIKRELT
jgi:homeobox protein cut-like